VDALLGFHGALLFRGFALGGAAQFDAFVRASAGTPLHRIFFHNENSYSAHWPLKILFFCVRPAEEGGQTPLADVRRVLQRIPRTVRERFERRGWSLVRNLTGGRGLSWQTAFQTESREEVDRYCRANDIAHEWPSPDHLRLRYVRPAIARHPRTGEEVWFNHAAFFHLSTLDERTRASLLATVAPADLPYDTCYGDGAAIEPESMEAVRASYEAEAVAFPWQRGDLLLVDNMLVAHARAPFRGDRLVLVGMTDPHPGR
jgi:alpha-ketoglutarate-dependent taurine dioxygenase